ncbi:phosphotransferase enzyme family protein [Fusarium avenaceum]|nr:phosphotransferase enzyme family protein [Fusarium avenaceum]
MPSYLLPNQLLQGSSVTFYDSSFFTRGLDPSMLPTPSEVLARPKYVQNPQCGILKPLPVAVFKELGLVVKHSQKSTAIIAEGQCLWAIRRFMPEVPIPEIFGWTQENGIAFLYMEYIDGITLRDRWDTMTSPEKDAICEQLKTFITKMSHLRQAPDDQFIGMPPQSNS